MAAPLLCAFTIFIVCVFHIYRVSILVRILFSICPSSLFPILNSQFFISNSQFPVLYFQFSIPSSLFSIIIEHVLFSFHFHVDPVLAAEVATFMDCVKLTADQVRRRGIMELCNGCCCTCTLYYTLSPPWPPIPVLSSTYLPPPPPPHTRTHIPHLLASFRGVGVVSCGSCSSTE